MSGRSFEAGEDATKRYQVTALHRHPLRRWARTTARSPALALLAAVVFVDGRGRGRHAVKLQHAGGYTWVWLGANGSIVGRYIVRPTRAPWQERCQS
jgi:hypothetical protein